MRTHLTLLQGGLVVLLIGSAILFLVGSTIERNNRHHETAAAKSSEGSGEKSKSGESGGEGSKRTESHATTASGEAGATILGVNTESLALSIVAVVLSLVLAGMVWLGGWPRLVLLGVLGFGLVFAAGDGRELVHQLNESNNGLASVAAILLVLHLTVAGLAAAMLRLSLRPGSGLAATRAA
jgi:hypothetical protein